MQRRRHVRELDEVAEVLDRRVAAALVEVAHERRAVRRREHRVLAADGDAARRIARVLDEIARRARLDDAAAHAGRTAHALAVDVGAGGLPDGQRFRVVAVLDADFREDGVGVALDRREALLVQHLVARRSCA